MLRRPEGLDRLIEYSAGSCIPSAFTDAVTVVREQVLASGNEVYRLNWGLEVADRLFRSKHPFRHELTARYAIFFGESVGIMKVFSALMPERQSGGMGDALKAQMNIIWSNAKYCKVVATHEGWPFFWRIGHMLMVKAGRAASLQDLKVAPSFLEQYYSVPRHISDVILLANNV